MNDKTMKATKERLRAPVQWFGGKGNMLAKLMRLVPDGGKPYCESMETWSICFAAYKARKRSRNCAIG